MVSSWLWTEFVSNQYAGSTWLKPSDRLTEFPEIYNALGIQSDIRTEFNPRIQVNYGRCDAFI